MHRPDKMLHIQLVISGTWNLLSSRRIPKSFVLDLQLVLRDCDVSKCDQFWMKARNNMKDTCLDPIFYAVLRQTKALARVSLGLQFHRYSRLLSDSWSFNGQRQEVQACKAYQCKDRKTSCDQMGSTKHAHFSFELQTPHLGAFKFSVRKHNSQVQCYQAPKVIKCYLGQ